MASTYENDLRLEEMATGENSGSWGTKTNNNLELVADAFSYGTEIIADADTPITIADGAADAARSLALKITSSEDLTTTRLITLGPSTTSKVWIIENSTSGGEALTISAGSGSNITLANGTTKIIATDGIGAGSNVVELTQDIAIADLFVDDDLTVGDDIIMDSDGGILKIGADADLQVTHSGTAGTITNATGDLTLDVAGDILLDADGADIKLLNGGTHWGSLYTNSTPNNLYLQNMVSDGDIYLSGSDGGSSINALVLDMSEAGAATFNVGGVFNESGADSDFRVESDSNTHALFVDASANVVGMGISNPSSYYATDLVIAASNNGGITIRNTTDTTSTNYIMFADGDSGEDRYRGIIQYTHSDDRMVLHTNATSRLAMTESSVVFNEDGRDTDFRVESDGNTHMLFVDAGNDRIGIQTAIPSTTFQVDGLDDGDIAWFRGNGSNAGGRALRFGVGNTTRSEFPTYLPNMYSTSSDSANGGIAIGMFGGTSSEGAVQFWTGDSSSFAEKMRIQRGGNIVAQYGAVFNEGSNDSDFRVESADNGSAIFVDADQNAVAILNGTDTNIANLSVGLTGAVVAGDTDGATIGKASIVSLNNTNNFGSTDAGVFLLSGGTNHGTAGQISSGLGFFRESNATWGTQIRFYVHESATSDIDMLQEAARFKSNEFVANETSNDYDFRVESDSNSHMLFVDAGNNRIGLDTSNPLAVLDIHGSTNAYSTMAKIYLTDVSGHAESRNWSIGNGGSAYGAFTIGVSNAAGGDPQASGTHFNPMIISKEGNVVFNEDSKDADFRVESDALSHALFVDASNNSIGMGASNASNYGARMMSSIDGGSSYAGIACVNTTTSGTRRQIDFFDGSSSTRKGSIETDGSNTSFNTSSDYRLKENVTYTWDATTRLKQLKPARFDWIGNSEAGTQDGFLAHEVSSVVPFAVSGEKDAVDENGNINPQSIDHSKLVSLLVKTIQELEDRITALENA